MISNGGKMDQEKVRPKNSALQKLDFTPVSIDDTGQAVLKANYTTADERVFQITARYQQEQWNEDIAELLKNMQVGLDVRPVDSLSPRQQAALKRAAAEYGGVQEKIIPPDVLPRIRFDFQLMETRTLAHSYAVAYRVVSFSRAESVPQTYSYGEDKAKNISATVRADTKNGGAISARVDPGASTPNPQSIPAGQNKPLQASSGTGTTFTVTLGGVGKFKMSGSYTNG
jgi:hypothetical protein